MSEQVKEYENTTAQSNRVPRVPTIYERREIMVAFADHFRTSVSEQQEFVENAYISVFEDYRGHVFYGKIATIIWAGSPDFVSAVSWDNDRIKVIEIVGSRL